MSKPASAVPAVAGSGAGSSSATKRSKISSGADSAEKAAKSTRTDSAKETSRKKPASASKEKEPKKRKDVGATDSSAVCEEDEQDPLRSEGAFVYPGHADVKYIGETYEFDGVELRHGRGTYRDGETFYEGDWQHDAMAGHGTMSYATGARYVGSWLNGMYDGVGTYEWPSGARYHGEFHANKLHGRGVFTDETGREWHGQFFNNSGPGLSQLFD